VSYILEALKKSEMERQQAIQQESEIAEVELPSGEHGVSNTLAVEKNKNEGSSWVLKAVYLALLVILVFILLKLFKTSDIASNIKPLRDESSVDVSLLKAQIPTDKLQKSTEPTLSKKETIAVEQAPIEVLTILPDLAISSHIYSTQSERRSIVVNSERLQEGGFIAPQVQIKEITHQGMVIEVNGWSLVVGRSRGWSQQ
jgi:general secretion pathway protein B